MSYLKFSDNLFLGKQELTRFKQALDDNGFRRFFSLGISNYGVVQNASGSFTNFQTQIGTNTNSIKVLAGYAIDSAVNLITFPTTDNIPVPADSNWYWVKIAFTYSALEQGTFSVDTAGNLTGVNSNITAVLRGIPNNPSKIKFPNAVLNTGEYFVNTITNDSSATLSGTFVNESNLTLSVVGSFTPDAVPLSADKQIFQYDSCTMTLVLETVSNTPPTLITGKEFLIARVQNTGVGYNIQDKRSLNLFNGSGGANLYLPLSGGSLSGTLNMTNNFITNLPAAIASGQAVRYEQVIGQYLLLSGGNMSGVIAMGSNKITDLAAATVNGDAVRYEQVIGIFLPLNGGTMTGPIAMGNNLITGATTWTNLSLSFSWTNESGTNLKYSIDAFGNVRIVGNLIAPGSFNSFIASIPAAIQPSFAISLPIWNVTTGAIARIAITNAISASTGVNANNHITIDLTYYPNRA